MVKFVTSDGGVLKYLFNLGEVVGVSRVEALLLEDV